jgi:epoxyqueuosine reductase
MTTNSDSQPVALPSRGRETVVKDSARDVGFAAVGIADVNPSPESDRVFDRWIREGKHGDMRYLSGGADKRHTPRLLLDGARSVISVAVDYYSRSKEERNQTAPADGRGVVAIYAHGRDYHGVLREMLGELDRRLKTFFPDMTSCIAVDTQPFSERDMAVRAGVGWLGKNTCVISPNHGSWIFFGELFTDLSLQSDKPLETLCGSCTACVDACPTGALDEPFIIDANKCISYLTIEKRGELPGTFHRSIGPNVFGCDMCQRVCPVNNVARESLRFGGTDRNPLVDKSVDQLARIGDEEFRELTRDSAISRCKPEGMRRNARIAARNISCR